MGVSAYSEGCDFFAIGRFEKQSATAPGVERSGQQIAADDSFLFVVLTGRATFQNGFLSGRVFENRAKVWNTTARLAYRTTRGREKCRGCGAKIGMFQSDPDHCARLRGLKTESVCVCVAQAGDDRIESTLDRVAVIINVIRAAGDCCRNGEVWIGSKNRQGVRPAEGKKKEKGDRGESGQEKDGLEAEGSAGGWAKGVHLRGVLRG